VNPDSVTRCFGLECPRRSECARHVALLIKTMPHTLAGINVCEAMGNDRSIPLRRSDEGQPRPAAWSTETGWIFGAPAHARQEVFTSGVDMRWF